MGELLVWQKLPGFKPRSPLTHNAGALRLSYILAFWLVGWLVGRFCATSSEAQHPPSSVLGGLWKLGRPYGTRAALASYIQSSSPLSPLSGSTLLFIFATFSIPSSPQDSLEMGMKWGELGGGSLKPPCAQCKGHCEMWGRDNLGATYIRSVRADLAGRKREGSVPKYVTGWTKRQGGWRGAEGTVRGG